MMTIHQMIMIRSMQTYVKYKAKKVMMMTRPTMAREIKMNQISQKMTRTYIRLSWQREISRSSSWKRNYAKF